MIPFFTIFGKTISIYTILILAGIFTAGIFACRQIKKRGQDEDAMIVLLLTAAAGALAGGHLLYAVTTLPLGAEGVSLLLTEGFSRRALDTLAAAFGGSVFYGGLLGGLLAGGIYYRKKGLPPLFADVATAAIPLFHAFGRVGCFLGGCCYGVECPIGFVYTHNPIPMANGVRRFPVQLLEALFCLGLFWLLFALLRRGKLPGRLLPLYLCCYGVGRFFLEFLRGDSYRGFLLGLSTSQFISVLLVLGCGVWLAGRRLLRKSA